MFLHRDLDEKAYMKLPPSLSVASDSYSSTPPLACKLKKSLYDLRQAFRQWYAKLSSTLQSEGFQPSLNDYSLFRNLDGNSLNMVVVCVDEILMAGNDVSEINALKQFLDDQFKIKYLGKIHYFLRLEVVRHS